MSKSADLVIGEGRCIGAALQIRLHECQRHWARASSAPFAHRAVLTGGKGFRLDAAGPRSSVTQRSYSGGNVALVLVGIIAYLGLMHEIHR